MAIVNPSALHMYKSLLNPNLQDQLEEIMHGRMRSFLDATGPIVAPDGFGVSLGHYQKLGAKRYEDARDGPCYLLTLPVVIFKHLAHPFHTIGVELKAEFIVNPDFRTSNSVMECVTRSMRFQLIPSIMVDTPYSNRVCTGEDLQMGIIALANDMASALARR